MITNFALSFSDDDTKNIVYSNREVSGVDPIIIKIYDVPVYYDDEYLNSISIDASMFLPPVDVFRILIDTPNCIDAYVNEYIRYLNSEIPMESCALILAKSISMYRLNNKSLIIFQMNVDTYNSNHMYVLFNHLFEIFGVNVNAPYNDLSYYKIANIANCCYEFNIIDIKTFVDIVPKREDGTLEVYNNNISKADRELKILCSSVQQ